MFKSNFLIGIYTISQLFLLLLFYLFKVKFQKLILFLNWKRKILLWLGLIGILNLFFGLLEWSIDLIFFWLVSGSVSKTSRVPLIRKRNSFENGLLLLRIWLIIVLLKISKQLFCLIMYFCVLLISIVLNFKLLFDPDLIRHYSLHDQILLHERRLLTILITDSYDLLLESMRLV